MKATRKERKTGGFDPDPSCTRSAMPPPPRMSHLLDDAVQVDPGEALKVELAAALLEEEAVLRERRRHAVVHYRLDARLRRIPEAVVHAAGTRGGGGRRARVPLLRRGRGAPHRGRANGPWAASLRPTHKFEFNTAQILKKGLVVQASASRQGIADTQ